MIKRTKSGHIQYTNNDYAVVWTNKEMWETLKGEFECQHEMDNLSEASIDWLNHLASKIEIQPHHAYSLCFDRIEGMYIFNEIALYDSEE